VSVSPKTDASTTDGKELTSSQQDPRSSTTSKMTDEWTLSTDQLTTPDSLTSFSAKSEPSTTSWHQTKESTEFSVSTKVGSVNEISITDGEDLTSTEILSTQQAETLSTDTETEARSLGTNQLTTTNSLISSRRTGTTSDLVSTGSSSFWNLTAKSTSFDLSHTPYSSWQDNLPTSTSPKTLLFATSNIGSSAHSETWSTSNIESTTSFIETKTKSSSTSTSLNSDYSTFSTRLSQPTYVSSTDTDTSLFKRSSSIMTSEESLFSSTKKIETTAYDNVKLTTNNPITVPSTKNLATSDKLSIPYSSNSVTRQLFTDTSIETHTTTQLSPPNSEETSSPTTSLITNTPQESTTVGATSTPSIHLDNSKTTTSSQLTSTKKESMSTTVKSWLAKSSPLYSTLKSTVQGTTFTQRSSRKTYFSFYNTKTTSAKSKSSYSSSLPTKNLLPSATPTTKHSLTTKNLSKNSTAVQIISTWNQSSTTPCSDNNCSSNASTESPNTVDYTSSFMSTHQTALVLKQDLNFHDDALILSKEKLTLEDGINTLCRCAQLIIFNSFKL